MFVTYCLLPDIKMNSYKESLAPKHILSIVSYKDSELSFIRAKNIQSGDIIKNKNSLHNRFFWRHSRTEHFWSALRALVYLKHRLISAR